MVLLRHRPSLASITLFVTIYIVGNLHSKTCAFAFSVRSPYSAKPTMRSSTILTMAKGGVHGKKTRMMSSTKKKKTKNPNKPGKHRKTSKRDNPEEGSKANKKPYTTSSTKKPKLSILGETKKAGPPWQVMGEGDSKKNVEAEKVRRERIRLGLDSPSDGNINKLAKKADVSGSNRLVSTADRTMLSWKRFNPVSAPSDLTMVGAYLGRKIPPSLGVPEVAFLGRSNVGKSSLLNKLVSKAGGDTARVGKTPGATASVNLYALLGQPKRKGANSIPGGEAKPILGFADLPGFGYAKLSKETKANVEEAAERYLGRRRELALGVLLVDSRRTPTADDRAVLAALFDMGTPLIVVATKSDKLKGSEVEAAMSTIREGLGLPDGQPLRVSGVTGENVRDLWRIILDACETRVDELKSAIEEGRDDGGVMRVMQDDDDEEEEEGEIDDWYNEDLSDDEGDDDVVETFVDGEDIVYDQGYDWVQGEGLDGAGEQGAGDFYDNDNFYDGDGYVSDEVVGAGYSKENEEKQRLENDAFKLVNLEKRVADMERRGEI